MRIVITGATGNIGTATRRRLAAEHTVIGLARRVPSQGPWRAVDLTTDSWLPVLRRAFEDADAVIHLAWGFQPSHDLSYLVELGVGGTRRVLRAASEAGVPHLVHVSSIGAYSPRYDDVPVDESWPHEGVPTSRYSRHKVAAELLLDDHDANGRSPMVTRIRPTLVGQREAGSELLRYTLPAVVPARTLGLIPVLPLDKRLRVSMLHADDVADALARVVEQRAGGAFNLSTEPPLTAEVIAEELGARLVHVPSRIIRPALSAAWHLRLQQVDTGWLDMAYSLPLLDATRARTELGWEPTRSARSVLREVLDGMREKASNDTAVMRRRTVPGAVLDAVRRGPVGLRDRP